jgi:hypothetical protein
MKTGELLCIRLGRIFIIKGIRFWRSRFYATRPWDDTCQWMKVLNKKSLVQSIWSMSSRFITTVPLPSWHKLNYFLFCRTFEKLFIICVKNLIKLQVQLSSFELQTLHDKDLKLRQSRHTRLFHNIDKTLFIILYIHYLLKILELKNQMLKLRFQI